MSHGVGAAIGLSILLALLSRGAAARETGIGDFIRKESGFTAAYRYLRREISADPEQADAKRQLDAVKALVSSQFGPRELGIESLGVYRSAGSCEQGPCLEFELTLSFVKARLGGKLFEEPRVGSHDWKRTECTFDLDVPAAELAKIEAASRSLRNCDRYQGRIPPGAPESKLTVTYFDELIATDCPGADADAVARALDRAVSKSLPKECPSFHEALKQGWSL